jgi:hypothetical protein
MRTLRKLVLGETWALPIGITVAVGAAAVVRAVAGPGGWWETAAASCCSDFWSPGSSRRSEFAADTM